MPVSYRAKNTLWAALRAAARHDIPLGPAGRVSPWFKRTSSAGSLLHLPRTMCAATGVAIAQRSAIHIVELTASELVEQAKLCECLEGFNGDIGHYLSIVAKLGEVGDILTRLEAAPALARWKAWNDMENRLTGAAHEVRQHRDAGELLENIDTWRAKITDFANHWHNVWRTDSRHALRVWAARGLIGQRASQTGASEDLDECAWWKALDGEYSEAEIDQTLAAWANGFTVEMFTNPEPAWLDRVDNIIDTWGDERQMVITDTSGWEQSDGDGFQIVARQYGIANVNGKTVIDCPGVVEWYLTSGRRLFSANNNMEVVPATLTPAQATVFAGLWETTAELSDAGTLATCAKAIT